MCMQLVDRIWQILTVTLIRLPIRLLSLSFFLYSFIPPSPPTCLLPSLVIFNFVSLNISFAVFGKSAYLIVEEILAHK